MPDRSTDPGLWTSASNLARAVFVHFAVLLVAGSWAFGGQSPGARQFLLAWGTVGIGLFVAAALAHRARGLHPAIKFLWPLWLYDLIVIASCFNPGFRETWVAGETMLVRLAAIPWLPSAAVPVLAARGLWLFNGLVLSAFAVFLVVQRRGQIRALLFLLGGNAVALAVFGTFQKLSGAEGLWFGRVVSPNPRFFATFVYHNHWGAFTLLNLSACLALLLYYERRGADRDLWHSPVLMGAVTTLLLAASIPLSASRSSTALAVILLGAAFVHVLLRVRRRRREHGESAALPVAVLIVAAALSLAAIGYLGRDVIAQRSRLTEQQLRDLSSEGTLTSRLVLYRDTWRMAADRPVFGWGLDCYGRVFPIYNTQRPRERWFKAPVYLEAHNDWFQSLAETGFAGTTLLVLLGVLPLASVPWRRVASPLPRYLLGGNALLLVYAALEFPFANPIVVLTFSATFYCAIRYAQLELRAASSAP